MGNIHLILAELTAHGYVVLFAWVAAEMLGVPLPTAPLLLATGVLTATGRLSFPTAWILGVLACFIGDAVWYSIGRMWGAGVLRGLVRRISFESGSCSRRASEFVGRYGSRTMLLSKFVPGVNIVAVSLTASSGTTLPAFLPYDIPGSIVYVGAYLFLGRMLGARIQTLSSLAHFATRASIGIVVLSGLALVAFRYIQRRSSRRLRFTPEALPEFIAHETSDMRKNERGGSEKPLARRIFTLVWLSVAASCVTTTSAQQASAPDPQPATIIGTVLDANGGVVPDATVVLNGPSPDYRRTVITPENGFFQFANVRPGPEYHVTVGAPEFANWTSNTITLTPGQYFALTNIQLRLSTVQISVAAVNPEQLATEQVRAEERQRVLGIIPNFYVSYDHNRAPLTPKLKFHLAFKALTDPVTVTGFVLNAGIYQAADYPGYRGGMAGYGQRLGATFAGGYTNVLVGDALLPSLLHQDPRYFYQGDGTTRSRLLHALSNSIFTTGNDGRREINYSAIGGDLASGAIANAYYPAGDRGAGLVVRSTLIGIAGRAANDLLQEFVLGKRAFRGGGR